LEIRKLEILPNGRGVMEDDIIAGLFALVHLSIELVNKEKKLICVGNLLTNASGVYFLIKIMGVQYLIAKMNTAIIVAIGYNYPLQKGYVFKTVDKK
jgi:hypothetical protein